MTTAEENEGSSTTTTTTTTATTTTATTTTTNVDICRWFSGGIPGGSAAGAQRPNNEITPAR